MKIERPHGYLRDADGRIVARFANWEVGDHNVVESVESVDYVDGPAAHGKQIAAKYKTEP